MTKISLTSSEHALVEGVDDHAADMVSTVERWSSQNSGSHNCEGLIAMRSLLSERFSNLPGSIAEVALPEGQHVCLLYTSPSPRDLSTSRMPSSA